jgi:hypothetical protein
VGDEAEHDICTIVTIDIVQALCKRAGKFLQGGAAFASVVSRPFAFACDYRVVLVSKVYRATYKLKN